MSTILFIKANDRPSDQAVSVRMYDAFLNAYKEANPSDTVVELDLYEDNIPHYGNTTITALYKSNQGYPLTAEEQEAADIANRYLNQFLTADKVVIAFPLWNYAPPSPLISYISYLAQAGKTFKYTEQGAVGLAGDKKVALLSARGGVYSAQPMDALEAAVRPIRGVLNMIGIEPQELVIEGHNQYKDRSAVILAEGLEATAKAASGF